MKKVSQLFVAQKTFKTLALFALLFCMACSSDPNYAPGPVITFNRLAIQEIKQQVGGVTISKTRISITLNFKDGDGDLGLTPSDTNPPFNLFRVVGNDTLPNLNYYNIFPTIIYKLNNRYDTLKYPLSLKSFQIFGRFPPLYDVLDPSLEPIDGSLNYNIESVFSKIGKGDTIKLMVSIQDRKLNKSNTVITPEVIYR